MNDRNSDGLRDLALWRTFLAAQRSGSVSAAARMLGIAQSSVTTQLQALERSMGEPLFIRHARGIVPTPRADDLAARLSGPLDALALAVGSPSPATAPPVRIGGAGEFVERVVMPALAPMIAEGRRITVTTGLADELLEQLGAGSLDLVLSAIRPKGRALPAAALVDEEFALVAAPSLGVSASAELVPSALEGTPLLAYAHDVPILRRYWRHVFGLRLEREPALIMPDLRALAAAAVAGAGATVLPTYLIAEELAEGRLAVLRETDDPPINTLYLVRRPGPLTDVVAEIERALRLAVA
ncbi:MULTISPECIES: LysR family transcriptional regulator [unclassified Microbacterium]|uniref:LysR family transcriptional regulator n=1 Tax=unclassified Microbacterium TaxID=2609290 RepID=UPI000CFBE0D8|nr:MULTISPECIES: LysR family transcriptional regulator [unclassified Microbacterium]PQZ49948.1 LysR family transcriptional regulator [Microbacterium sp. MYb43]PQZ69316.1 LysR family transcriptional regulator [Microbacterium sp. MYb40]PRB14108.1 LysR family transcriptional regulator [Microbacterium sp. MYb54]PRB20218.1 LysR family transcriptional regulator [Microbacterium sp. MYb50]PRB58315.1 LysR family transcriptional regulator [Microbacterium sp. MYb24]